MIFIICLGSSTSAGSCFKVVKCETCSRPNTYPTDICVVPSCGQILMKLIFNDTMLNTGCLLSSDLCYTQQTGLKTLELKFSVQVRFRPAGLQRPQVQQEDGRPQQTRIICLSRPTCF